jgi:hypothetical protein
VQLDVSISHVFPPNHTPTLSNNKLLKMSYTSSSDESSDFESSVVYSLKTFTTLSDSLEIAVFMGKKYLSQHAGRHTSITNGNIKLRDNFSQLLILEVTGNE